MSNKRRLPTSLFLSTGVPDTRLGHEMHLRILYLCDNGGGFWIRLELWMLDVSSWICIVCLFSGGWVLEENVRGFTF